jgi:phosphoglycolate phosphatase-like HAD superfamily hydrolase
VRALAVAVTVAVAVAVAGGALADPLPSWNAGATKEALLAFVRDTTTPGPRFVPPSARVAVFDNDGTLWVEQPLYVQGVFALDRVHVLAPQHPEWRHTPPFAAILAGDTEALLAGGARGVVDVVTATHTGMSSDNFSATVAAWLEEARHPRFDRPYTTLVYQPMLELLALLRARGYATYIVTGGGIEFVRVFSERVYGIAPPAVIGSSTALAYERRDGAPILMRLPKVAFVDDKAGKPVGIQEHIGQRPVFAAGNSDGDFEMLEWTTSGPGARLGILVHHTDAEREYAYDRDTHIGRLARALDEAPRHGWIVVDMKRDWKTIFPPR